MFYLTQHLQNIVNSTCNQSPIINKLFYILFFVLSLGNPGMVHTRHISAGTDQLQVLCSQGWPVAVCGVLAKS